MLLSSRAERGISQSECGAHKLISVINGAYERSFSSFRMTAQKRKAS